MYYQSTFKSAHKKPLGKGIIYFSQYQDVSTTILITSKSKKHILTLRICRHKPTFITPNSHTAATKEFNTEPPCDEIVKKVAHRGCKFDILFYFCTQMWL